MNLPQSEVHIWSVDLNTSDERLSRFLDLLTADERAHAEGFHSEQHRRAYVLARASLRLLLSSYLDEQPEAIEFTYSDRGKPRLAGTSSLRFNLGHSGDRAIFAFNRDCELGVDIEIIRPVEDLIAIAVQFFSEDGHRQLLALPSNQRERAFFALWTRKEAQIKATGEGLAAPLDQLTEAGWIIHSIDLDPGVAAAVAYRPPKKTLKTMGIRSPDTLWP